MREAHAHILALGESLTIPTLDRCGSVGECVEAVRAASGRAEPGAWIRFHSARVESWKERRWPTLAELDRAAGDHPCVLMSFDHHAAAANSAAMRESGLGPGDVVGCDGLPRSGAEAAAMRGQPGCGEVCVDGEGRATGLLMEQAAFRAWTMAPAANSRTRREWVARALEVLAGLGFTEVHDLHTESTWLHAELDRMARAGELPVQRVRLYPPAGYAVWNPGGFAREREEWNSDAVRVAGLKVFSDGTLNSRTALMLHPYREPIADSPRGRAMVTEPDLDEAIRVAESLNLHVAVHAIGDGAVRMVLDAIERTGTPRPPGNRHRIEHAEIIDAADVPRFAGLGVACSVQPCHLLADIEVLNAQLPHRLDRVLPLRELIDSGCRPGGEDGLLWFGSDVPIVRADPGDSIRAAVHRRRAGEPEERAIAWGQRITEAEAWAAFDRRAAFDSP